MAGTLFQAAANDDIQKVLELFSEGMDINKTDQQGCTALFTAAQNNSVKTVGYLLEHKADTETKDSTKHYTPLIAASENNHEHVVRELLKHGAEVNAQSRYGESALFVASDEGHTCLVSILIEHGADVNLCKSTGSTPLYIAAYGNHVDVVNVLLQHGAEADICRRAGGTALYIAAKQGHPKIVEALLTAGADTEKKHQMCSTALSQACAGKYVEVVKLLCTAGADVTVQDKYGYSLLHKAVERRSKDIVDILVKHGIPLVKNKNGQTALDIARDKKYTAIVAVLEKHFPNEVVAGQKKQPDPESEAIHKAIRQHYETFVTVLSPTDHMDFLFAKQILGTEEMERIAAQPGPMTKARELMKTLMAKADHSWVLTFVESLQTTDNSHHLVNLITGNHI